VQALDCTSSLTSSLTRLARGAWSLASIVTLNVDVSAWISICENNSWMFHGNACLKRADTRLSAIGDLVAICFHLVAQITDSWSSRKEGGGGTRVNGWRSRWPYPRSFWSCKTAICVKTLYDAWADTWLRSHKLYSLPFSRTICCFIEFQFSNSHQSILSVSYSCRNPRLSYICSEQIPLIAIVPKCIDSVGCIHVLNICWEFGCREENKILPTTGMLRLSCTILVELLQSCFRYCVPLTW
jgi:hypothetical protein